MYRFLPFSLVLLAALPAQDEKPGKLEVPTLFSDHMVIQRGVEVPVWGWSEPVTDITVSISDRPSKSDWIWKLNA